MTVFQSQGRIEALNRETLGYGRGPTRGLTLFSGGEANFETYGELYKRQPNIRLVNGFLARNIAQLGLHGFTKTDTHGERVRLDAKHPLTKLIRRPNPYTVRYDFTEAQVLDLGIYDFWAAIKLRNSFTGELNLFRIPPYMVTPTGGNWMFAESYTLKGDKTETVVPRDQMVVIHGYNPTDTQNGLSPIESLRGLLAEAAAAGEWREQYWRNAARMSGIIERPIAASKWSETARNRFRADFQATYAGNGALAGATPVLEEGMVWKPASFSAKDSEYLDARRLSREEGAAAYFISPLFVGILEHANFSNVNEQHKNLYQDTLGPRLVQVEENYEAQLVGEFPDLDPDLTYLEFNIEEKLRGTFQEQAAILNTSIGGPWMSRNEGRALVNLPSLGPVGDEIITPLNVTLGTPPPRGTPTTGLAAAPRLGPGRKLALPAAAKDVANMPAALQPWVTKHAEVLGSFFARQKASVIAKLGAGQNLETAFQADRWDSELGADLFGLAATMTSDIGTIEAEHFGAEFDETRTTNYLSINAGIAAQNINNTTLEALDAAITTAQANRPAATKGIFDDLVSAAVGAVFDFALGARSDEIAATRSTFCGMFASHEAAYQAGQLFKVWNVNSSNPRDGHPSDGETVAIDDTFSNGARWPGDPESGADQTANCSCSLSYTTEEP